MARQKEKEVCSLQKTPENEIMRLLSKFYGVDSIAEAMELVTTVKVTNQINALKDYLSELGMSRVEIANSSCENTALDRS